jgi:alkylation response protein AidB-like acyl-CoA dehydrogenase
VTWAPAEGTRIAVGEEARGAVARAFDRGALATAAQLLGVANRLIEIAANYAREREQFGKPIGSFQAVKHHLANAMLALEFARPVTYRAAYSIAHAHGDSPTHVSMAKAYASDAALLAARTALQVHGAIGYTWEHDLHLWMKRAWALAAAWGDASWHRERVAQAVLG